MKLLREVVAEQKDVPLVVLKAEGSKAKLIDDDSVSRSMCRNI